MIKYLLKYAFYILIALVFSGLISLLTQGVRWELLPLFTLLAYILRFFDDYFDYDTDTKEQPLSKSTLRLLLIIFCAVFVALNICFFRLYGLISVLLAAYALLQNRFELMKPFFLTLVSAFYIAAYTEIGSLWVILYLCGSLLLSVGFFIYKKKKKKK